MTAGKIGITVENEEVILAIDRTSSVSAHASSHSDGDADEITLENLATSASDDEIFKAVSGGIVAIDMDALKTLLGLAAMAYKAVVQAGDMDAEASTDGQVLTSDGAGNAAWEAVPAGVSDHGALTGLSDDDHAQYHNDSRGDARYYTQSQVDTKDTAAKARANHTGTQALSTISDAGTAAAEDVGTVIGDVVQLEDVGGSAGLPAVDGSQLTGLPSGVTDHGALTGLSDDDHTQYHNDGRADTWLATKSIADLGTKSITSLAEWISSKLALAGKLSATFEDVTTSGTVFNIESTFVLNPASANSGTLSALYGNPEIKSGNAQNFTGYIYGTNVQVNHKGTGTASNLRGMRATVANYSTGTITNAWAQILRIYNLSSGVVTNAYGLVVEIPSGTIANVAGIAVDEQAASTGAVNLLLGTSTIPSGDYSIYNASNKANRFDGALSVMPTSNAFGYASPYIAFIIGDIDTTSPNGSNGGAYTGARYNKSNDPFVILSPWDDGAERYIYYGGGGWNLPDAMAHEFYAAETYNETDDQGVLILRLDFDGATFSKLATFSAGINESAVTDHEAALSITESQISDLGDYQEKDATILSKSANYTVLAADAGKIIECDGTFTITLPDSLDSGFQVVIVNVGSGTITIAASTTLQSKDSNTDLANQYGAATAYHRGSNVWCAFGDLS